MPKVIYFLVSIILLSSIINNASGQSNEEIDTILVLYEIPSKLVIGERMYFSGHIKTVDGQGLANMPIEILATHDRGVFILLKTISDDEGNFKVEWIIENIGTSVELEAHSIENENYRSAWSKTYTVDLKLPGIIYPELELNSVMPVMIADKSVFSGYLKTEDGKGIADAGIIIEGWDDEGTIFDIATAATDSNGFFQTKGNIQTQVSKFLTVMAHYEGENKISSAYSDSYNIRYISELNGINLYKEEYYLKETVTIIGAFREQLSTMENQLVQVEIVDPLGTLYDSHSVTLDTDGTFTDELTINDGLTGRYTVKTYLNDDFLTTDFVLLNKADINPDTAFGPFCRSEYIQGEGGTIVGDVAMVGTTFTLNHEGEKFDILVFQCGNAVESLALNQQDRYIIIKGIEDILVEVLLPSRLLDGDFTVFVDDDDELEFELLVPQEYITRMGLESTSEDINVIRVDGVSSDTITIQGTTVIPEFPVVIIMLAVTMLMTILVASKIIPKTLDYLATDS